MRHFTINTFSMTLQALGSATVMETTNAVTLMRQILRPCLQELLEAEFFALHIPHLKPILHEQNYTQYRRYKKPVLKTQVRFYQSILTPHIGYV
jgi:hypothetical protein